MFSKSGLLVLNLCAGVCKWLRGRGDVDHSVFEFTLGELLANEEDVHDSKNNEELDGEVGASEEEYDLWVLAI